MDIKNKPRVFLSHSKVNRVFIERAYADLRRCQIDPWLDSEEIRHGRSWLGEIFENGLPTCDCILIYLTDASINSAMVQKELDAGLLQKLKDQNVAFLPYVEKSCLRERLRIDIQSLQVPEWNDENYSEMLPRIVAEIWRSFLERAVTVAINSEKALRLEAQLELEKIRNRVEGSVFNPGEEKDFAYICEKLSGRLPFTVTLNKVDNRGGKSFVRKQVFDVQLLSLFAQLVRSDQPFADAEDMEQELWNSVRDTINGEGANNFEIEGHAAISDQLRMLGLAEWFERMKAQSDYDFNTQTTSYYSVPETRTRFTQKAQRFRYWLAMNDKEPGPLEVRLIPE